MSLHRKMARGALWSLIEKGGQQGVSFIVFMVVARLVGPAEYGLANVCFVVFTIANLTILTIVDGIVNLQIDDDDRLSTLFWTVVGMGFVFSAACYFGAAPLAAALEEPRLVQLLQEFAVVPILLATSSVPNMILMKNLDFRIFALRSLAASLIGGAVGIALALKGGGAHALIAQQVVLFVVVNLVVWPFAHWRPRLRFCGDKLLATISPGLKMVASMLVSFSEKEVPRILILLLMNPVMLGYYSFVVRVRHAVQDICVNPPLAVLYPALARLNDQKDKQRTILEVFIIAIGVVIFPVIGSAAITAPLYMPLLFGDKWNEAITLLQLFIICGATLPFQVLVREMLRAHNHIEAYLRLQVAYVAVLLIATLILLPHGLLAVGYGTLGIGIAVLPIYFVLLDKWEGVGLWRQLTKLLTPLAGTILLALVTHFTAVGPCAGANPWLRLFLSLAAGWAVYSLTCVLLMRDELRQIFTFVRHWQAVRAGADHP
ncbi:oligosaccharide flippase family protein [Magnetospirillum fulvum]|uniref:Membrane protein involved in the export of O-antigen and teichoic acid n=1 Tax=Magnetospirillum fulvum TaxID=1082 RepID=A0A1H6HA31_MAGFU|nr:oligosaccharide flippase family protein [Magnetospirillum fulvum]SEH32667.1 Membrane protein involved in the export of O-antigen and teichoic acid [Magnetospirillum fulvum]